MLIYGPRAAVLWCNCCWACMLSGRPTWSLLVSITQHKYATNVISVLRHWRRRDDGSRRACVCLSAANVSISAYLVEYHHSDSSRRCGSDKHARTHAPHRRRRRRCQLISISGISRTHTHACLFYDRNNKTINGSRTTHGRTGGGGVHVLYPIIRLNEFACSAANKLIQIGNRNTC